MREPTKDRFSRLLAACEQLTRDEAAALSRRSFAALTRAQEVKSAILAGLAAEAATSPLDSDARSRLTRLLNTTRENQLTIANLKAAISENIRKTRAAANRLHTLRPAYTPAPGPRFFAHG
jgi:hypothetical protein